MLCPHQPPELVISGLEPQVAGITVGVARCVDKLLPGRSWRLGFTVGVSGGEMAGRDGREHDHQPFQGPRRTPVSSHMQAD